MLAVLPTLAPPETPDADAAPLPLAAAHDLGIAHGAALMAYTLADLVQTWDAAQVASLVADMTDPTNEPLWQLALDTLERLATRSHRIDRADRQAVFRYAHGFCYGAFTIYNPFAREHKLARGRIAATLYQRA